MDSLAKTADAGGSVADAAALDAKVGDMEQRLQGNVAAALDAQKTETGAEVQALQGELAALKAKLGALAEAKLGDQSESRSRGDGTRPAHRQARECDARDHQHRRPLGRDRQVRRLRHRLRQSQRSGEPPDAPMPRSLPPSSRSCRMPRASMTWQPTPRLASRRFPSSRRISSRSPRRPRHRRRPAGLSSTASLPAPNLRSPSAASTPPRPATRLMP